MLFQSLFYWNLLFKKERNESIIAADAVSILVLLEFALQVPDALQIYFPRRFQSLFYWNLLFKRMLWQYLPWALRVSILVLLEFALQGIQHKPEDQDYRCFNPCFIGICSSRRAGSERGRIANVSILVLLEFALQDCNLHVFVENENVSILVLLEFALQAHFFSLHWHFNRLTKLL